MKKNLFVTLSVTFILLITLAMSPSPSNAATSIEDVTVVAVGIFNDNYYKISFQYEGYTYMKLFPAAKKDWLAIALTALSNGGKAELQFNPSVLNGGKIYSISAK